MDSRLFDFKLTNHKIFDVIKDSLNNESDRLQNLIEVKDDVLFVWNSVANCLLTLNLKSLENDNSEAVYQELHLISPPAFTVERLLASACGTRICLWGSRGATVLELPSKWGQLGLFDGGKKSILCKSPALDERLLYTQADVRRVHWHPDSVSQLLVLLSDNTIRLYNVAIKAGVKLTKILNIGPKPSGLLAGRRILESLGDTAVDFTPSPDSSELLILRGNGDVYTIDCNLSTKSPIPPSVCGPLTMYPPADDNYGEESCSITVLGGGDIPPVVVIATSSAILYHCLLLPENNNNDFNESLRRDSCNYALYVIEAVELNIILSSKDTHMQYNYPVHLYPCSGNSGTYACVHAAGVHVITLPVITQLKEYATADDGDANTAAGALCSRGSIARYAVCTHGPSDEFQPPVGLATTGPPLPALLVLCNDRQLLIRTIEPYDLEEQLYKDMQLKNPALVQDEIKNILKERQKLSFSSIIQEILTRDVSQPILRLPKKEEPSPKESLEFLTQATLKLRQEYILRQGRAVEAIRKKLHSLMTINKQQDLWSKDLKSGITDVKQEAELLREKCAIAESHQEGIKHRCATVIRALRASAATTPAERDLLRELENYKQTCHVLSYRIDTLKERLHKRTQEVKIWEEEYRKKDIALGRSHSDTISSILQQQTSQISTLIEDTKLLKDQLSIV